MTEQAGGTYENKEEAVNTTGGEAKAWLQAISTQEKSEKEWREKAKEVSSLYVNEGDKKQKFNILFSNTQTIAPAIYNSKPLPDIRERYGESQVGKYAANVLERAITFSLDTYDFHPTMQDIVLDMVLVGRGVPRVRYEPEITKSVDELGQEVESVTYQSVSCELVDWDSIVIGPAKRWSKVPWIAFKHYMTRDQLKGLAPKVADKISMDEVVNGADDQKVSESPSMFKRALVYEIWDKESGEVCFVCKSYPDELLKKDKPAFNLSGFYPIPRPIYAAKRTDSLKPTIPYCMYEEQAKELDLITKRISALTKCLKWRGVYAKGFSAFGEIEKADDGEFIPTEQDFAIMSGMGLDKAVLFMPIQDLITVIRELYASREQTKQTIYEITGISDILRGSTKATETLGAQQLKAQWGSLRISDMQEDVQRIARDLIRMKCEIIAENFEPQILAAITGMEITPDVLQLLRNDMMRRYQIDIETDSTIRADLNQAQKNVSEFVTGFGSFIQAVGPAVQAGAIPMQSVAVLLKSFARNFKLGRQAEDEIDKIGQQAAPQQPNGQAQAAKEQQAAQAEMQVRQAEMQATAQTEAQKLQLEKYKIDTENQTKLQIAQMQIQADLQIETIKAQTQPRLAA